MSNKVGDIYGTVKDGKSCVKIESEIVDILVEFNPGWHNQRIFQEARLYG